MRGSISDRAAHRDHHPTVYFEEWDDPMISGIQWVSELVALAGGRDVFADRSAGKAAKERFVSVTFKEFKKASRFLRVERIQITFRYTRRIDKLCKRLSR